MTKQQLINRVNSIHGTRLIDDVSGMSVFVSSELKWRTSWMDTPEIPTLESGYFVYLQRDAGRFVAWSPNDGGVVHYSCLQEAWDDLTLNWKLSCVFS